MLKQFQIHTFNKIQNSETLKQFMPRRWNEMNKSDHAM